MSRRAARFGRWTSSTVRPFTPEGSGEFGAVGACSFDTYGGDCAVGGDEVDAFPVSGSHGQEFLVREGFAVFVDDGHVVCVGVGVDTRDDFCWLACQDGNAPQSRRMLIDQARARWADKTVMGLVVSGSYEVMSAWLDTPFNGP